MAESERSAVPMPSVGTPVNGNHPTGFGGLGRNYAFWSIIASLAIAVLIYLAGFYLNAIPLATITATGLVLGLIAAVYLNQRDADQNLSTTLAKVERNSFDAASTVSESQRKVEGTVVSAAKEVQDFKKQLSRIADRIEEVLPWQGIVIDCSDPVARTRILTDAFEEVKFKTRGKGRIDCYLTWTGNYEKMTTEEMRSYFQKESTHLTQNPNLNIHRLILEDFVPTRDQEIHDNVMYDVHMGGNRNYQFSSAPPAARGAVPFPPFDFLYSEASGVFRGIIIPLDEGRVPSSFMIKLDGQDGGESQNHAAEDLGKYVKRLFGQ